MHKKSTVIILFIIVIVVAGILFWQQKRSSETENNIYADDAVGFSIGYPDGYTLNSDYKYQALGPDENINGVKFVIPAEFAAGTNLSSYDTGVSVEYIPSVQGCDASLFLYTGVSPELVTDNGIAYSFASSTDAGAGNRYEEYVWAAPGENYCIAVRYLIHYGVIENYPEGTVSEFDRENLINQFDEIRDSLIIF